MYQKTNKTSPIVHNNEFYEIVLKQQFAYPSIVCANKLHKFLHEVIEVEQA